MFDMASGDICIRHEFDEQIKEDKRKTTASEVFCHRLLRVQWLDKITKAVCKTIDA